MRLARLVLVVILFWFFWQALLAGAVLVTLAGFFMIAIGVYWEYRAAGINRPQ